MGRKHGAIEQPPRRLCMVNFFSGLCGGELHAGLVIGALDCRMGEYGRVMVMHAEDAVVNCLSSVHWRRFVDLF